jgi:uncharacterized protein (DUF697 family)
MRKLPKAIRPATSDTPEATDKPGPRLKPVGARAAGLETAERNGLLPGNAPAMEASETAPTEPVANDATAMPATRRAALTATQRRTRADAIVRRHAAYAAVGGIMPLPLISFAGVTTIILRMVKRLSDHYGVPFERDRARTIVIGMMGGATPTGLGAVASSTLAYMVPASGLIGLAVSTVAAAATTRGIGRVFVEHFESGATLDHDPENWSPAFGKAHAPAIS